MKSKVEMVEELLGEAGVLDYRASLLREMAELLELGRVQNLLSYHSIARELGEKYLRTDVTRQLAELLDPVVRSVGVFEVVRVVQTRQPDVQYIRRLAEVLPIIPLQFFSSRGDVYLNVVERTICTKEDLPTLIREYRELAYERLRAGIEAEAKQVRLQMQHLELLEVNLPELVKVLEPYDFYLDTARAEQAVGK